MDASRSTIAVLAVAIVLALASPAAAVTPDSLAPSPGANVSAGSPVTFQVRSAAGDTGMWVHVSKSSQVDGTGVLDGDADSVALHATGGAPDVFEGTAPVGPLYTSWLNRAGLYYWQPYRIDSGEDPDGYVEGPIRELSVTGTRPVEIGPQPVDPADGAVLPTGSRLSFRASTLLGGSDQYLWVHVSRSGQRDSTGRIGDDVEIEGLRPSADPNVWFGDPAYFTHSTFWMNVPGTYFWQPYRISSFGDPDGYVEGPTRTFTLTGTPAPTTPTTPTTPTVPSATPATIRGAEAFVKGTANDLYLACTTLDVYLIDVLPAGKDSVWITGAADLRLTGRTVTISLDGRRVGTAVVGPTGAFQATVRAPSDSRRPTARYQARVGTARSQQLRLQRRMVAARLTRTGTRLTFTGRVSRPFARRPATVQLQRYLGCGRVETRSTPVRPNRRTGRFTVRFALPATSAKALMYRARTKVAPRRGRPATSRTYTLPRAVDVG